MDLKKGVKAVADLEANASRLSKLIPELTEVKSTLAELKMAEVNSKKQLQQYEKNLAKLEGQLTESIQIKLAEGLAEVSSRTKDIYDQNLSGKLELENNFKKLNEQLSKMSDHFKKIDKSINDFKDSASTDQNILNEAISLGNKNSLERINVLEKNINKFEIEISDRQNALIESVFSIEERQKRILGIIYFALISIILSAMALFFFRFYFGF